MKGQLTVSANDEHGITISAFVTMNPESYSEGRTVRELIGYLLDYEPAKPENIKTEAKEEEANG